VRFVVLFLAVTIGVVIQNVAPTPAGLGRPEMPILLGITLYVSLLHAMRPAVVTALFAGLVQDAMGHMPLGYHAFAYVVAAYAAAQWRDVVMVRSWTTHALLGAAGAVFVTLFCGVLLIQGGLRLPWGLLALKAAGSALAGAIVVPIACRILLATEARLGLVEAEDL
jgi:rod shape-determining protein MreD